MKPGDPSSIYAAMFGAGLFLSHDAAGTWKLIHDHDWPIHLDFDTQNPDILYFGADSNDLYRSTDNGTSWERISGDFHTTHGCFRTYPVAHPAQAGAVYFGMGACGDMYLEPGEGGVFYSSDYGDTWAPEKVKESIASKPLGRFGEAVEVSNTILFLASEEASYITGACMDVNGGMLMD